MNNSLSNRRAEPLTGQIVVTRAGIPPGLDLAALPEPLAAAVHRYADRLGEAKRMGVRGAELDAAVRTARSADQEALTAAYRRGEEPKMPRVSREDHARMLADGHRRKIDAMESVLDEEEHNLVRAAAASLPEVEAIANSATESFSERVNAALTELRGALIERQRRRAALGWARDVAAGRRGKVLDGGVAVDDALRGVQDLLRR